MITAQSSTKLDEIKKSLKEANSDSIRIKFYGNICWFYARTRAEIKMARKYADSIKILAYTKNDTYGIARYNFYNGVLNRLEGNYLAGLESLSKSVKFHRNTGDSLRLAQNLYQTAVIHSKMGGYDNSLQILYNVLDIAERTRNKPEMALALQAIGNVFFETQKFTKAIEFTTKAMKIYKNLNEDLNEAGVLIQLGNILIRLDKFEASEKHYKNALMIYEKLSQNWGEALVYANIAFIYDRRKEFELALEYHLKALKLREKMPNKEEISRSMIAVGLGYAQLQKYETAKTYIISAIEKAKEIGSKPLERDGYTILYQVYEEEKDYEKAFEFHRLYSNISNDIFNEKKSKQITELQTKYEAVKKDKKIALLIKENEIQETKAAQQIVIKNGLLIGLALITIIGGLFWYTLWQRLKNHKLLTTKNREIEMSQLREELKTLEMKALRVQMNPHFLFNSLNSINTMILQDKNENASAYLGKFSKLVRLILENSEQSQVSLKNELEMLVSYIQLEAVRFDGKIEYKIKVENHIDQESTFLPSMVLQPFVENAIWHGLLNKESKGFLAIEIREESEHLCCSIIDNGIGREKSLKFKKDGIVKKKSMGIKITADRLRLLTREKMEDLVKIIDLKDDFNRPLGTQVNIVIPIS